MNYSFGGSGADPQSFGAPPPPGLMCARSSTSFGGFGAAAVPQAHFSMPQATSQMCAFGASAPPPPQLRSMSSPMNLWGGEKEERRSCSKKIGASASFSTEVDSTVQVAWEDVTFCRSADGSFPPSPTLTALLHLAHNTVEWNTCLVVAWLEERRSTHVEGWGLVTEKALKWLNAGGHLPALLDAARMVVRGERCTQGHPLTQTARQAGELWHCDSVGGCAHAAKQDGDHPGVASWRCSEDMRVKPGGGCNYDICEMCKT